MEVKLDKRYPVAATADQAWSVLSDVRAVAACMPGAQITEQVDPTHYKGSVKSKVGPAVMSFAGDIEVLGLDLQARTLALLGKGADKAGSSASMQLSAGLQPGASAADCVLAGQAVIIVNGKLAQFGSRLLVPVSDALLAQFADNFSRAAAAVPLLPPTPPAPAPASANEPAPASASSPAPAPAAAPARAPAPAVAPAAAELNALALGWTVFKSWLAQIFGRRPG